jgi:hypothetical protein
VPAKTNGTPGQPGLIARTWRRLKSPSARWSVLALVGLGFAAGAVAIIGTQVMVEVTGTEFTAAQLPFDAVGGQRAPAKRPRNEQPGPAPYP